ncbi:MAG: redoxin family protein, partial [Methylocystis sp.]
MTIKAGDKLPDATFVIMGANGPEQVNSGDYFKGRKVLLFSVPGAFTPTCHKTHLPGFVAKAEAIKARGVERVAVVA